MIASIDRQDRREHAMMNTFAETFRILTRTEYRWTKGNFPPQTRQYRPEDRWFWMGRQWRGEPD
jgi:hypothetical protein